jgi:hypothetical protein
MKHSKKSIFPDYGDMKQLFIKRDLRYTQEGTGFYCSQVFKINGGFSKLILQPLLRKNQPVYILEREKVAIPTGEYSLARDYKGKHRFLKVLNVPNRFNIEIHVGNYLRDTIGCPLVGQNYDEKKEYSSQDVIISESKDTCEWLINDFFLNDEENQQTKKVIQDEVIGLITIA